MNLRGGERLLVKRVLKSLQRAAQLVLSPLALECD